MNIDVTDLSLGYEGDVTASATLGRFPEWNLEVTVERGGLVSRLLIDAPGGMSPSQLHDIPLGAVRDAVARAAVREAASWPFGHFRDVAEGVAQTPAGARDDTWYVLHVAVPYSHARGKASAAVHEHLAEVGVDVKPATVRSLIYDCRPGRRGLLTKAQHGKSKGDLTAKARRILERLQKAEG